MLEGFRIDHLKLGEVKIEQLYLKWDNALQVKAASVDLSALQNSDTPMSLKPLSKLPRTIRWIEEWVQSIDIGTIRYGTYSASLHYLKGSTGKISIGNLSSQSRGTFDLNTTDFTLNLPSYSLKNSRFAASMHIKLPEQTIRTQIIAYFPQTPKIVLNATGDTDTVRVWVHSADPLLTVKPIVDFFALDPEVVPWIVNYAKASSLHLHRLEGRFRYDKPDELLQNLIADASAFDASYTFAQGFEPVRSPKIDLHFAKGKLYIYPRNGTFYTLPTEQSHVVIDFTAEHTLLEVILKTAHGKLNDPISALLAFYDIQLPIKQQKGECAVDLKLSVNLHTLDTTGNGIFIPTASEMLLDKIVLQTQNGIVKVEKNHVSFNGFGVRYGDMAHAAVNGEYNTQNERGIVTIDVDEASLVKGNLSLYSPNDPLRITYLIAPGGDTLNAERSQWNLLGERLGIESFHAPFDYHRAYAAIRSVPFSLGNNVKGEINGLFDGTKKLSDFNIRLHTFKLNNINLNQSRFDVDLHYGNDILKLQVNDPSSWSIHQLPLLVSPFSAVYQNDLITFDQIEAVLGDLLKANLTGSYRMNTHKGTIRLSDMVPLSPKLTPIIESKEAIDLIVDAKNDPISIDAPDLKAHFTTAANGWKITLSDISLITEKSPILRRYHINNGFLNLFYTGETSRLQFNGEIDYLYPLMVINDTPIDHYRFSGSYQNDITQIRVNDRITITNAPQSIYVRANNSGLNLPMLFKFLSAHQNDADFDSSSDSKPISIHATNSYLYLMKERKIITDTLNATLNNDNFDASFQHMNGSATLKIRNNLFSINGKGFNDNFMEHLFALSDFSGGNFSFEAKGRTDSFDGLMRVDNTILKDYRLLNNVLAFVNTVPSLATFSLPNYNAKGLPVSEGYAHFGYQKGTVSVDNFTLNSPEMKITGNGQADFATDQVEGVLTLKTDLGSKLGKVPMVGYILLGEDGSISTTLTVSGKLDNPKVSTAIAKEIVTAPFNILKRTLVYPFLWMMDEKKK